MLKARMVSDGRPKRLALAGLFSLVMTTGALAAGGGGPTPLPGQAEGPAVVSVGEFLVRYARAIHLPLPANAGPGEAIAELRAREMVPAGVDPDKVLTEGDVIRFASAVGLRLKSLDENRPFGADKLDPFFKTFGGVLNSPSPGQAEGGSLLGADECNPDEANCGDGSERAREKRKKKKEQESPPEP